MDFFHRAKVVLLRSQFHTYLTANKDKLTVAQGGDGSSTNAQWKVEFDPNSDSIIRLKSCYGQYLTASNQVLFWGKMDRKVLQTLDRPDSSVDWEPIKEGNRVRLRTPNGNFLRANKGWRSWLKFNTVTCRCSPRTTAVSYLWEVEVLERQNDGDPEKTILEDLGSHLDNLGSLVAEEAATVDKKPSTSDFDVFLNFRGPDIPSTVIDAIDDTFLRAGIRIFYDNKSIRRGSIVDRELMEAITNSKIYITIFSKDYASSRSCLSELEKIIECWEASQKQKEKKRILPIFYDADVSTDLKLKWEVYTTALKEHKDIGEDTVKRWDIALQKAAKIKGFHIHNHRLTELMKPIVEEVCCMLWPRSDPKKVPDDYVGMDDSMKEIMKLLDLNANDVRFVTIHGVGGVGKTTLARLIFDEVSSYFRQGVAFLSDIREKSRTDGIVKLQKDLMSQLLHVNLFELTGADQGVNCIKERLKNKKVLIVLDDLDQSDQMSKLAGKASWFGVGSRIIITSRNNEIIPVGESFYSYKMREMKSDDALKLFSRRVFKRDSPPEEYQKISSEVVDTTGGLPLAINVIAPLIRYNMNSTPGGTPQMLKEEFHKNEAGTSNAGATISRRPSSWDFEVFLNFRGPDSRSTVVSVLHDALVRAGIRVFYDDRDIKQREEFGDELQEAITNSKIYIPILSMDYASCTWCLRELASIVECWEASQTLGEKKTILPIFYNVNASTDVKLKSELYTSALQKHVNILGENMVKPWEKALQTVATMRGWDIRNHGLVKLVELIVEEVCRKLLTRGDAKKVPDDYVGTVDPMDHVMKLIDPDAHDVRFVTIHGTGGIGKTTLARLVFHKIFHYFPEGVAFLSISDICEKFRIDSIVNLQKDLLSQLDHVNSSSLTDSHQGVSWIKNSLRNKKVLVVLDGLDKSDQLSKLAGEISWFGVGSRVIVTTTNDEIIPKGEGFHQYEMKEMKSNDALKLFSRQVFDSDSPPKEYDDISRKVVDTTRGHPLVITVIAPLLRNNNNIDAWEATRKMLEKVVRKDVRDKLMISYGQLDNNEREIFLDIACLFIDKEIEDATCYWEAQQLYPKYEIIILKNMSFIEMVDGNRLQMHDVLRDLGRHIVYGESSIPERCSRLWSPDKALSAVHSQEGTKNVVALKLGKLDANCKFNHKQFAGFEKLMFLELDSGNFENDDFKKVFSELRWLSWDNCPAEFGATNLCFEKLNVLILSENQITDDWGGWYEIKAANNLKVLKCINCRRLMKSPDFSAFPKLERLVFKSCGMLREINQSIGMLEHLTYLEFTDLFDIVTLPDSIGRLKSLSVLKLKHMNIQELPTSIEKLQNLKYLCLWCPKLTELPESVGDLKLLFQLDISHSAITRLPESFSNLDSLKVFECVGCPYLKDVPDNIKRLVPLHRFDPSSKEGIEISKGK